MLAAQRARGEDAPPEKVVGRHAFSGHLRRMSGRHASEILASGLREFAAKRPQVPAQKRAREAKLCRIDGLACKPGRPFCPTHQRAYDCIRRDSEKTPDARTTFLRIFGDGRSEQGTPSIADKVLQDFVKECPDGSARSGKKRGNINLASYEHTTGTKKSRVDVAGRPKYDKEAFIIEMERKRKWCD
eukprot:15473808-Alexandrium_andersonii.AAC.1